MAGVRTAVKKLPKVCEEYCKTLSILIERAIVNGNELNRNENSKKLRGYLEALRDMNVITDVDVRALYLYYATIHHDWDDTKEVIENA